MTLTASGGLHIQIPSFDAGGLAYDPILRPETRDNFTLVFDGGSLLVTGFREAGSNVVYLRTRETVLKRQ